MEVRIRHTGTDSVCIFKYLNHKPNSDPLVLHSVIYNIDCTGPNADYSFDNGDSFTNVPCLQEFSIRYKPGTGVTYWSWTED